MCQPGPPLKARWSCPCREKTPVCNVKTGLQNIEMKATKKRSDTWSKLKLEPRKKLPKVEDIS